MTTTRVEPTMGGDHIAPEVQAAVRRCIAESLAIEEGQIQLESRLIDDLGADSLDFVDIVFMLEQALDVRMRESELSFLTRLDFSSPEVMTEGYLTESVVSDIEKWLPTLRDGPDKTRVTPAMLFSFITVEAICIVATRRLAARSG